MLLSPTIATYEPFWCYCNIYYFLLSIQELEAIKARVKEMEEEAEKLKDMQKEIEGSLNLSMSPTSAGNLYSHKLFAWYIPVKNSPNVLLLPYRSHWHEEIYLH